MTAAPIRAAVEPTADEPESVSRAALRLIAVELLFFGIGSLVMFWPGGTW